MERESGRSLVVEVIALATVLGLALSFTALGQQRKDSHESLQADPFPKFIKAYSKDGKQSLTGNCKAKDPATGQLVFRPSDPGSVNEITCTLILVRYFTPDERPKEGMPMPSTDEEFVKYGLRDIPKFAEELKRNPTIAMNKAREEWNKGMDELFCSKESIARLQKQMREMPLGPKMKGHYQTVVSACLSKDFEPLIATLNSQNSRTCSIWIESFTLHFKRIGKGKWLTGSEPQGLCNVVEVFELESVAGISSVGSVKSTVLAVGGTKTGVPEFPSRACKIISEEAKEPMLWSVTNQDKFEPTCDFIKHDYILAPFPEQ